MSIGYDGEGQYGVYHSAYDSLAHYLRFGDPNLVYGITQAKTTGRMMLRLANADVLPFETSTLAETVARYLADVKKLAETMRGESDEKNRQLRDRTMELAADPLKPFVAPKEDDAVPHLELAPLENAVARLQKSARAFDAKKRNDATVMRLEQLLTRDEGLPGRPW